MPTLSELTGAGRSDVLPGYVLSVPRLREWGEAESEAGAAHVRAAREAGVGLAAEVQAALIQQALDNVANGQFGMGMPRLDAFLRTARAAPFVLWLCLKAKHPHMTREQVADLLTPEQEEAVAREVLALWDLLPPVPSKKAEGAGIDPNPSPPTGPGSSDSSGTSADSLASMSST